MTISTKAVGKLKVTPRRRESGNAWKHDNQKSCNEWERRAKESRGKTLLRYSLKLLREAAAENIAKRESANG